MGLRKVVLITGAIFYVVFGVLAKASVGLPVGSGPTLLPGSTSAVEADLAGGVIHDQLIPFRIVNAAGALLFAGQLQNRVVKSTRGGVLHFYNRIRDTKQGLNGIIRAVTSKSFATTANIKVDWRPDGLGTINPINAQRSAGDSSMVQFNFDRARLVLVGGQESKFFYVKTSAKNFDLKGETKIQLVTGESVILNTAQPQ